MATTSERVVKRLRDMGVDVHPESEVRRLYSGPWQRAAGAWSWSLFHPSMKQGYGSQHAADELLKCAHWTVEEPNHRSPDLSIDPCGLCRVHEMGACRA